MSHRRRLAIAVLLAGLSPTLASALTLGAQKDSLFAYPGILASEDGGDFVVIDYNEARDINRRDDVPERRVKARYLSLGVRRQEQDVALPSAAGVLRTIAVGATRDASLIVIYLHGQGGSRKQGVDDFTFGGNFNRVKNLVTAAGGLYLSPDFSDFGETGAGEVAALLLHYSEASPTAKIFIACGSMGGGLCYELANNEAIVARLGGLLLLGSHWDDSFLVSPAFAKKVPMLLAQGSHDVVFDPARQEAFYRAIRHKSPGYPVHFVRFETGTHGTPIRMTDWRTTLNWMLQVKR